jgi:hypothetical protein
MIVLGGCVLSMLAFFVLTNRRARRLSEGAEDLHGSARWASSDDIERTDLLQTDRGVYVGGWFDEGRRRLQFLRHNGPEHVLASRCRPGLLDNSTSRYSNQRRSFAHMFSVYVTACPVALSVAPSVAATGTPGESLPSTTKRVRPTPHMHELRPVHSFVGHIAVRLQNPLPVASRLFFNSSSTSLLVRPM